MSYQWEINPQVTQAQKVVIWPNPSVEKWGNWFLKWIPGWPFGFAAVSPHLCSCLVDLGHHIQPEWWAVDGVDVVLDGPTRPWRFVKFRIQFSWSHVSCVLIHSVLWSHKNHKSKGAAAKLVDFGPVFSDHLALEWRLRLGKQKSQKIPVAFAHADPLKTV